MRRFILITLLTSVCMLICGCSAATAEAEKLVFEMTGMSAGLGGNDDLSESDYSYTIYLAADESMASKIKDMRLLVGDKISELVTANDPPSFVLSTDGFTIEGILSFRSKGLTKMQIVDLEPYVKSLDIIMEDGTLYTIPL